MNNKFNYKNMLEIIETDLGENIAGLFREEYTNLEEYVESKNESMTEELFKEFFIEFIEIYFMCFASRKWFLRYFGEHMYTCFTCLEGFFKLGWPIKHPLSQQFKTGTPIHHSFHGFQPIDIAFDEPVTFSISDGIHC